MTQIARLGAEDGPGPDEFRDIIECVRNCTDAESLPDMLRVAAAMVEHAAYVMTRQSDGGPTTQLMLVAAEIESIGKRIKPRT